MIGREVSVQTPEGVTFSWPLAGPVARFLAWSIDAGVLLVGSYVIQNAAQMAGLFSADVAVALGTVLFFVFQMVYGIVLEWRWRGQTIGKRVLRIRVIDSQGLKLHASQIIVRNIMRGVDSLPLLYLVGGLACVWTRHAQRLGDIAAGTVVVQHESASVPQSTETIEQKYNSLRAYPHLAARLRQRSTPQEAELALRSVTRRDSLETHARLELFDELAAHFQAKVQFPPEAVDGLSSEQYVRDVVQILFETSRVAK